jgi:hypothetical protein
MVKYHPQEVTQQTHKTLITQKNQTRLLHRITRSKHTKTSIL